MPEVYIVSAKRTPIGRLQGALSSFSAPELGAIALRAALDEAGLPPEKTGECLMGQVLAAGSGQAPARQAALKAGLSASAPCLTVNKVCGSGMKAIMLACDSIILGRAETAAAGGQESMSRAPHFLPESRGGFRLGEAPLKDSILEDGLLNPSDGLRMGDIAEMCAEKFQISRQEQDRFAEESYKKALKAQSGGLFKAEIAPVPLRSKKQSLEALDDEEPLRARFDKIKTLPPIFKKNGTITAASASKINDGAAACLLAGEQALKKHSLKPMARVAAYSGFAQDPHWFTTAPVYSIQKILKEAGLKIRDIDLFEVNEAFAAVAIAAIKEASIPAGRLNVHGGAVALGHPIGASGARILVTLIHALRARGKKRGLASICLGGGEALSMIVEMAA